ncbi:MAG TPA: GntR family transcriptional regulator [Trueperaceae bacterium]|nr:GntR family transcriptional regulator [Trueperaceae bacterium]
MDSASLSAIRTERVTDTVYQMLRERIVDQRFQPGSKINVDEIAKQLDVSRTPVHEALTMLATDGLVEVKPRRGTFVTEFTSKDYAETLDIRRALEVLACETVCLYATGDDITDLEKLVDNMAASVGEANDAAEAARIHDAINLEFHLRLVSLSRNRRLIAMYSDLRAHLKIARAHVDATEWQSRVPIETREHRDIIRALAKRDVTGMKSALDEHLRRSTASLIADVKRDEGRETSS